MTTTRVRPARHQCDLSGARYPTEGDVVRCDDCGRHWRYGGAWGYGGPPIWHPLTRLTVWWLRRTGRIGGGEGAGGEGESL